MALSLVVKQIPVRFVVFDEGFSISANRLRKLVDSLENTGWAGPHVVINDEALEQALEARNVISVGARGDAIKADGYRKFADELAGLDG